MKLSLRADMHSGSGKPLATDPIGYQVMGLPLGHRAYVRNAPNEGFYLLVSGTEASAFERRGYFDSAEAALADLQQHYE